MALDDLIETLAEGLKRLALLDGGLHGAAQIGQQQALGSAGNDEGPVMLDGVDIRPGAGRQADLALEEVDLFLERQGAVGNSHQLMHPSAPTICRCSS
ncbi:hypothetical protein D3C81_2025650 [compost metagenome]